MTRRRARSGLLLATGLVLAIAADAARAMSSTAGTDEGVERLTVVLAGDTGLNMSRAPVSALGGYKFDRLIPAEEASRRVQELLLGDVVFANLETAVTDRNDLSAREKQFAFRTHPAAVKSFVQSGINVFSLANNHVLDYGVAGGGETLRHLTALKNDGLLAWPGLGATREAAIAPHVFDQSGARIAVSAIGIGGGGLPAPTGGAGAARLEHDFDALVEGLGDAKADLRLLSVHHGAELSPVADRAEVERLRRFAAPDGAAAIVAAHHAHVAKGVELNGNRLIAYGLGNFLHLGMRNMGALDECRDYGLVLRVTLARTVGASFEIESVEAHALSDMHIQPRALGPADGARRIEVLNYLGAAFDDGASGAQGLRFAPQPDGRGLWCAQGARSVACADWRAPAPPSPARLADIRAACDRSVRRPLVAAATAPVWPVSFTVADLLATHASAERALPGWIGETVDLRRVDKLARATQVRYRATGASAGATPIFFDFTFDPVRRRVIEIAGAPPTIAIADGGFLITAPGRARGRLDVPAPLDLAQGRAGAGVAAGGRVWTFEIVSAD